MHLSQAVETLALRKPPGTHVERLKGGLDGDVKIQFFEVNSQEFEHFESISNALIQVDKGTYGRCTLCGGRIEPDVLASEPWAVECFECGDPESRP